MGLIGLKAYICKGATMISSALQLSRTLDRNRQFLNFQSDFFRIVSFKPFMPVVIALRR